MLVPIFSQYPRYGNIQNSAKHFVAMLHISKNFAANIIKGNITMSSCTKWCIPSKIFLWFHTDNILTRFITCPTYFQNITNASIVNCTQCNGLTCKHAAFSMQWTYTTQSLTDYLSSFFILAPDRTRVKMCSWSWDKASTCVYCRTKGVVWSWSQREPKRVHASGPCDEHI